MRSIQLAYIREPTSLVRSRSLEHRAVEGQHRSHTLDPELCKCAASRVSAF